MTIVEKMFALKRNPLFRALEDSELILIAEVAIARHYPPGASIAPSGTILNRLMVVVDGAIIPKNSGEAEFPVIGIDSLVLESPVKESLVAGSPDGATCLLISKGHFFTIINECPGILTGYLERNSSVAGGEVTEKKTT